MSNSKDFGTRLVTMFTGRTGPKVNGYFNSCLRNRAVNFERYYIKGWN